MKNICFIANYDKTYFFDRIAKELEKENINIYWIVVNDGLNTYLEKDYKKENILYINKLITQSEVIGEYKLNELIQSDRILRDDKENAKVFLESIQNPIYNFLNNNKVSFVFGELTWAHEVLIYRICNQNKELNCIFLNPHTVRIPNGRFGFFEDEFQSRLYKTKKSIENSTLSIKIEKPDYLKLNDELIKNRDKFSYKFKVLKKFICSEGYYDPLDPTLYKNKFNKFKIKFLERLNKKYYFKIHRKDINFLDNKKFIFFPLHKQPEASIDVFGRYYENQLQLIENLWRGLPTHYYLIIKEHSNAIGDRDKNFYKKILSYPNIFLIDEKIDSHKILASCEAVFTVTGTIGYEAALLKKQSFTFVPTFFNDFSTSHRISLEDLRNMDSLDKFIESKKSCINKISDKKVEENIMQNSFKGIISDPESNIQCILDTNILDMLISFKKVINEH